MTQEAVEPRLTPTGRRYARILLSLVALIIALGPILGQARVPGFAALASVFPRNVREGVIPFASLLLALPALGVQFFATDTIGRRRLNRYFGITFVLLIFEVVFLYNVYSNIVVQVNYVGEKETAAYIVGSTFDPDCPCVKQHLPITTCIGHAITLNPAEVTACYPPDQINGRRSLLSTVYLLTMFSLGVLVGLLMLKEKESALVDERAVDEREVPRS